MRLSVLLLEPVNAAIFTAAASQTTALLAYLLVDALFRLHSLVHYHVCVSLPCLMNSRICFAGGMAGGFFATSIGNQRPLGIEGWRFAFLVIAAVSVCTGILTLLMASDPRRVSSYHSTVLCCQAPPPCSLA